MADILYLIIPCYNEQEVLPESSKQMGEKLKALKSSGKISSKSKVLFVDDGSKDSTWKLIESFYHDDPDTFSGVKLSRNRGHQNALLAGLMSAKDRCDFTISMDVDLQDDINAIDLMVDSYIGGSQVVYGVRSDRSTDSAFKRNTAQIFYKLMKFFGVDLVYNHADFRLLSFRALDALEDFGEVNLFLRGIVPMLGLKSDTVKYQRGQRLAGETKYPLRMMTALGWQGITSFSTKVFLMMIITGVVTLIIGLILAIVSLVKTVLSNAANWVLVSIWVIGGVNMVFVGIIGQYIGKISLETKRRPRYIIETILDEGGEKNN